VTSVRITEIFYSLQGESSNVGRPTAFVRLTGCPLRCQYCDSAYAFSGGENMEVGAVVEAVERFPTRLVTVTGGEPLAQPGAVPLMRALLDAGFQVSIETSGTMDVSVVDKRVSIVMDLKTPGSLESHRNDYANIEQLTQKDQVKFVICNASDYAWAKLKCHEYELIGRVGEVLFSPSASEMPAQELAEWVLRDGLDVRMQIQLHKALWGNLPGR
jgi:7-carboxy-7-deazaguanine synthase